MDNNIQTLLPRIQSADPDRYRAAQLGDAQTRNRLMTLYAFHLELAKVPELVSEPMIGEIRYQWWRDAVAEIYTDAPVRAHEVTTPLAALLRETNISRFHIDRLIDGRNRDLDPTPFADMDAARDYSRQTSGALLNIACASMGGEVNDLFVTAAGEAWGLTGLARAYGYYHGSMLSNLVFQDILTAAETAYQTARHVRVDTCFLPAFAYVGLVPLYLKHMRRGGFDPKAHKVIVTAVAKQVRLFGVTLGGRI